MIETAIAAGLFALIALLGWAPHQPLFAVGACVTAAGLIASSGLGLVYHVRLRAALLPTGALPRGWWWAPTRFHHALTDGNREPVLRWFRAGATMMGVCALGLLLVVVALVKALLAGGW